MEVATGERGIYWRWTPELTTFASHRLSDSAYMQKAVLDIPLQSQIAKNDLRENPSETLSFWHSEFPYIEDIGI